MSPRESTKSLKPREPEMKIAPKLANPIAGILLTSLVAAGGVAPGLANDVDHLSQRLLEEIERSFHEECLQVWYPRVKDEEHGGYLSDFDAEWKPNGRQEKFVVSQARHVWTTSQAAAFLGDDAYKSLAEHGFTFLRERMWDSENGGFHSRLTRDGEVLGQFGKSAYGNAFAIYGLASYHAASGDEEALDLAVRTFEWLEEKSWDEEFGGYVDRLENDGAWRGETTERDFEEPWRHVGLKDYNSSIHLLEAFTALYGQWPDPLLEKRLGAMLEIVRDRFTTEKGYLQLYFFQDWTPVSFREKDRSEVVEHLSWDHVSWGHDVETAYLLLEASHALGEEDDSATKAVAKKLVDHALETGWDEDRGGFFEAGYYFKGNDAVEVLSEDKVWWAQAESMNSLLLMSRHYPEEARYFHLFHKQWDYNQAYLIDGKSGGWYAEGLDTAPDAAHWPKAQIWKTSYHTARAYMNCIQMLREALGGDSD